MIQRLLELDAHHSRRLCIAESPGAIRNLAILLAHSGDSWFWLAGLALVWLLGTGFWKTRAVIMGIGILMTATVVLAVKFSVKRRRPVGQWGNIYRSTDPHSFPSGHAARAFMLAVIGAGLGPAWFGLLLLIWAPFVPLARVAMGVHYLSDILAGALFGLAAGLVVLRVFTGIF